MADEQDESALAPIMEIKKTIRGMRASLPNITVLPQDDSETPDEPTTPGHASDLNLSACVHIRMMSF